MDDVKVVQRAHCVSCVCAMKSLGTVVQTQISFSLRILTASLFEVFKSPSCVNYFANQSEYVYYHC